MDELRFSNTKTVGILGIFGNIFLFVIKISIAFFTHSQAMFADSFNSASDIFASLMTFIGNKISSIPHDQDHNFGHGKAEYIFSMFIGISMIGVTLKLLFDAIYSIIYGSSFVFSWISVGVCVITIITKFVLYMYSRKVSKKYDNILLEANVIDHRNDCIITTFTLLSTIFSIKGLLLFDSFVSIGISLWIGYSGIKIFIESYNVLMDISVDTNTQSTILDLANNYKDIKKVINIYSSPVGYQYMIFITIGVDGNMSTFESHNLADSLEKDVDKLPNIYDTIVHVEPL